jgi:hypothetical protein
MPNPDAASTSDGEVERTRRIAFNEDWAATAVGLVLLVLVLTGVIPEGLVP